VQAVRNALQSIQGSIIRFYPETEICPLCGRKLTIRKTTTPRSIVSLQYGDIAAQEVWLGCPHQCAQSQVNPVTRVYRSEQLAQLAAPRQKYGFDVLAKVGILRYLECRQRCEIQKYFETTEDLHIPDSTIQELIVRFAQTMAALHVHHISRLRQRIEASGGYVLHVDGTCEAGSQIHFVCMMGPEPIVLWSAKIGSENAVEIRNVLQQVDQTFGRPAATMADLSGPIHKAIQAQWPGLPFFYCHWHFLADVGKDLLSDAYHCLGERLRQSDIRPKLRRLAKVLDHLVGDQKAQARWICQHLETPKLWNTQARNLKAASIGAGMIEWILSASTEGKGRGFPFDLPHLSLCLRIQQARDMLANEVLGHLKGRTPHAEKLVIRLYGILNCFLQSKVLLRTVHQVQEANELFLRLRRALRLTAQDCGQGLNETADFTSAEHACQIETDVHRLHQALGCEQKQSISVTKRKGIDIIVTHLDKYWEGLFGHCLQQDGSDQRSMMVQRTNNMSERFFRHVKRFLRRITGKKKLNREINALGDKTLLVFNLKTPSYVKLICGHLDNLAQAFADLSLNGVAIEPDRKQPTRLLNRKSRRSCDFPALVGAVYSNHQMG